jgi:hypothetical protein
MRIEERANGESVAEFGSEATIYRNLADGLEARVTLMEIGRMSCYHRVEFRDTDADEAVAIKYYPRYTEACIEANEFCNGRVK